MQPCRSGRRSHLCTCCGQPPTLLLVRIFPVGGVFTSSLAVVCKGIDNFADSACALRRGSNVDGQLGSNATNLATTPVPVANASYGSPFSFASLSSGALDGCRSSCWRQCSVLPLLLPAGCNGHGRPVDQPCDMHSIGNKCPICTVPSAQHAAGAMFSCGNVVGGLYETYCW